MNRMPMRNWPLRYRLAQKAHGRINVLAWRYAGRHSENAGHPLWRLNDWLADLWIPWWIGTTTERTG